MSVIQNIRKRGRRTPPPKKKRLPPRSKKRAKVSKIARDADIKVESGVKAGRHQRRVTLNLLRHAGCTPKKLRNAINRLAVVEWDLRSLKKKDTEIIFGMVTDELADEARDEFVADLETIRDLGRHPRSGNPDNKCELCGHHHIRWEFDLRNTANGKDTKTGSTCIKTYGLNVDGYGTAEAALEALAAAIAAAQRQADREAWQETHPDHEAEMKELREGIDFLWRNRRLRWHLYEYVEDAWKVRVAEVLKAAKACHKYYANNQYLTDHKTGQTYGTKSSTGSLQAIRDLRKELDKANKAYAQGQSPADRARLATSKSHTQFWRKLIAKFSSEMSWHEQRAAEHCEKIGRDPDTIFGRYKTLLTPYIKAIR